MFVFLTFCNIRLVLHIFIFLHIDIDMGIFGNISIVTISTAKHCEVRRTHLIINLHPFIGAEERRVVIANHASTVIKNAVGHGDISVATYDTRKVSSAIYIVIDFELPYLRVILRRVNLLAHDGSWLPIACIRQPVGSKEGITTVDKDIGVARYIGRSDALCISHIFVVKDVAPSSSKDVVADIAVLNIDKSIAIYRAVLTSSVDTVEDVRSGIWIGNARSGFHILIVCRVFTFIRIRHICMRIIDNDVSVTIDTTEFFVVSTFRIETSLASCEDV